MASLAQLSRGEAMLAPLRRGGAAQPTGPAAIAGRARASERVHAVREKLTNAGR